MKTTSLFNLATTLVVGAALTLSACKKDKDTDADDFAAQALEQSGDETTSADELEGTTADIEQIITTGPLAGARIGRNVCGARLDSNIANHTYTITFDGTTNCNGRIRTGSATVTLYNATRWREQNAVLGITFDNVTVTRPATGRVVVLSGATKVYNVSGGLISNLYSAQNTPIVRRIRSVGLRSKNDGAFQEWNVAKTRTWTISGGEILILTVAGDTTVNGLSQVGVWGKTRRNLDYTTRILTPIVRSSACDYNASSGQKEHLFNQKLVSVNFGVDAQGQAQSTGCPYGALVTWTNRAGAAQSRVVAY